MLLIKFVDGIEGVEAGVYAGELEGVHTFLTDKAIANEKDTREPRQFQETEAEGKIAELKALFPTAKFETVEVKPEIKAGN